jgi:protein-S-isoprenylcysteine O-methyltransferase Ste14
MVGSLTWDTVFEIIFLVGLILYLFGMYGPAVRQYRRDSIADDRLTRLDLLMDMVAFVGWQVIPVVCVLTSWLDLADFRLPTWAGWVGVAIFAGALGLFWRAYADLGRNWSPTLQVKEEHTLVTHGVYRTIRHPVYAAMWLWGIAQPLLLQNWIAGFSQLVTFLPLYVRRIPLEERMMVENFGDGYREYMARTGRVIPRLGGPRGGGIRHQRAGSGDHGTPGDP